MAEETESKKSPMIAVWVALVGAIASVVGYFVTFVIELEVEKERSKTQLVLKLLREDSWESGKNLLWAHQNGLITLDADVVLKLDEDPSSAPTTLANAGEHLKAAISPYTEAVAASQSDPDLKLTKDTPIEAQLVDLAAQLDADSFPRRSAALQILLDEHTATPAAVEAAQGMLTGDSLEGLSANGRYNVLYFLNRVAWAELDSLHAPMRSLLETIVSREAEGISVGPKTRKLISQIKAKVSQS